MTVLLHWLDQIRPADRHRVGDKAFYLGELMHRRYPVATGCVVSAQVFRESLETMNWLEPLFADLPNSSLHVDVNEPRQLQAIARQIRQAILDAPLSSELQDALTEVAAKFSGSALMLRPSLVIQTEIDPLLSLRTAGLLESKLCWATPAALMAHLPQIWAELFRARSLFYWQRSRIQLQQINLAVLIQPCLDAIAAGTLRIDPTLIQIQAVHGFGIGLMRGEVQPEQYRIATQSGAVLQRQPAYQTQIYHLADLPSSDASRDWPCLSCQMLQSDFAQPVLSASVLQKLVRLAQSAAADLDMALQLEWLCVAAEPNTDGQIYLTQASPRQVWSIASSSPQSNLWSMAAASVEALKPSRIAVDETENETNPQEIADPKQEAPIPLERAIVTGLAAAAGWVKAPAVVVPAHQQTEIQVPPGSILVVTDITPDWLPQLKQIAGIVSEQGGMTCHGAIVAREMGVPAVVGATGATELIQSGSWIQLDGDRGAVYPASNDPSHSMQMNDRRTILKAWTASATEGRLPIATSLWLNLSQLASLDRLPDLPIDGLGLLRSELLLLDLLEGQHPQVWLQSGRRSELQQRLVQAIAQFAHAFVSRPVFYRALDWRSHEFLSLPAPYPVERESNPMLGLRGAWSYQLDPTLFDLELEALAQVQQDYSNVNLLLPFVRTVEEFKFCRQRVERVGLDQQPQFQLWLMAEVPSVLFLLPDYVKAGAQGISIGTNDLTQLLLGVDRDHPQIAAAFDERHPAVLAAIAQLIQTARQHQIPCSICGQAPARHPDLVESLIRWGITSISVEPTALEQTYWAIVRAEKKLLLESARD